MSNFAILANDEDPDGVINPASVVIKSGGITQLGGIATANADGTINYTPPGGRRGTDTFKYTVNDNAGATSNAATVRINIVRSPRTIGAAIRETFNAAATIFRRLWNSRN